jgi:hypothetical protein
LLSVAYAAAGDFDRAIATADEALALNPPPAVAETIRHTQELFRKREPYVWTW